MIEQIHTTEIGRNIPEYSVGEISQQLRNTVEAAFSRIRVRGEASGVSRPRSGHIYLKLVQEKHQLDAVIWRSRASQINVNIEDGIEYVVTGKVTTYSGRSTYQLNIDDIEEAGEGALLARLEKLKSDLQVEGLFDSQHKQEIPKLPKVIGVVSSPSGAVIQDIIHVLHDRFPRHVLLWPVVAQGPDCAKQVSNAISGFNKLSKNGDVPRPDVVIVARGGGSVEDLSGFSTEIVVRAAFESQIPLISAVGHETDTPLIDLVADLRAPTPSAAAEKAVPSRPEMSIRLTGLESRLTTSLVNKTRLQRQRLTDLSRGLPRQEAIFGWVSQRLDLVAKSLSSAIRERIQESQIRFDQTSKSLRQPEIVTSSTRRFSIAVSRLRPQLIEGKLTSEIQVLERYADRLSNAGQVIFGRKRQRLSELERLLETLSYNQVLKRGYAVIIGEKGLVDSSRKAMDETSLKVEFHDGSIEVSVNESP